jgi:hypothetical protein
LARPSTLCTTLKSLSPSPSLDCCATPALRASSIHFLALPFPPRGGLGLFSAPVPPEGRQCKGLALINHSADPRAWRTSPIEYANLQYEQRLSLCICGLYCPMSLHYSFSLYYLNYVGPYQYSRQLHLDVSPLIQSRASSLPSCTVHLLTSLVYFSLTCAMHVLSQTARSPSFCHSTLRTYLSCVAYTSGLSINSLDCGSGTRLKGCFAEG